MTPVYIFEKKSVVSIYGKLFSKCFNYINAKNYAPGLI